MPHSSGRGATEPLAALVAVAAVCAGLSIYAGALDIPVSTPETAATAQRLLGQFHDRATAAGVLDPAALDAAVPGNRTGAGRVNVTLRSGDLTWRYGPAPPEGASAASRRVGVRHAPGRIRPGRLRVVVW